MTLCECGGIGRRARLRGVFERVWVQVPSLAPNKHKKISCVFSFIEDLNPGFNPVGRTALKRSRSLAKNNKPLFS